MCLQFSPLETIVRSSDDHVSKTSPRDKGRRDSLCALPPQSLGAGHFNLVFSFSEEHLFLLLGAATGDSLKIIELRMSIVHRSLGLVFGSNCWSLLGELESTCR